MYRENIAAITASVLRTFKYSSLASCHSLVMVRGRMGLANMRVKAKTAKAPAMTAEDRRKTLRPSSGGGGRRGPWGPKAIKYAAAQKHSQRSVLVTGNHMFVIASHGSHQVPRATSGIWIKTPDTSSELPQHPIAQNGALRTSLLLLQGQFLPVGLHAIPKSHPQVGLLLRGHIFPSLLDVGQGRVGDGVRRLAGLLQLAGNGGSSGQSCAARGRWHDGSRAHLSAGEGRAQHCGGRSGDCRKIERKSEASRRGTCSCQWVVLVMEVRGAW